MLTAFISQNESRLDNLLDPFVRLKQKACAIKCQLKCLHVSPVELVHGDVCWTFSHCLSGSDFTSFQNEAIKMTAYIEIYADNI